MTDPAAPWIALIGVTLGGTISWLVNLNAQSRQDARDRVRRTSELAESRRAEWRTAVSGFLGATMTAEGRMWEAENVRRLLSKASTASEVAMHQRHLDELHGLAADACELAAKELFIVALDAPELREDAERLYGLIVNPEDFGQSPSDPAALGETRVQARNAVVESARHFLAIEVTGRD
ncbi:hypothetical protein [Sinomonas sp. P10A9]|uniref:Uncharacterized protein n=1 Tax=Sinomonas puerhi TaxID=3238584 RepID=A0AB39KYV9_9MICC